VTRALLEPGTADSQVKRLGMCPKRCCQLLRAASTPPEKRRAHCGQFFWPSAPPNQSICRRMSLTGRHCTSLTGCISGTYICQWPYCRCGHTIIIISQSKSCQSKEIQLKIKIQPTWADLCNLHFSTSAVGTAAPTSCAAVPPAYLLHGCTIAGVQSCFYVLIIHIYMSLTRLYEHTQVLQAFS
jgi:hypothetical protein